MTASRWDGNPEAVASARTPAYPAIGENDSYYGGDSLKSAYAVLRGLYGEQGLTEEQSGLKGVSRSMAFRASAPEDRRSPTRRWS